MASFLDKFADKVNNISNKVVEKTTSSTENIRLSSSIKDEERQINECYIAMGKKYREIFGSNPAPEFAGFISDIEKREALINGYRSKIQQNKGKVNCTNCGAEIDAAASFCDKCGSKNAFAEQIAREKAEAQAKAAAKAQATANSNDQTQQNVTEQTQADSTAQDSSAIENNTVKKFCKNCGNEIICGNVFCTNCGTRVDE